MLWKRRVVLFAAALSCVLWLTTGCGKEDEGCRSDHDCSEEEVCEPSGCVSSCEDDTDCPAGHECGPRRVEEGLICVR